MIKSEWDLISSIKSKIVTTGLPFPRDAFSVIGDDCFAFRLSENRYGLISTDISIEGTHFLRNISSPEEIGHKAMTGNLSDIAACGGTPKFAFVSIGIPEDIEQNYIERIYDGMISSASGAGTVIAGGDTSKSKELIISISIYGETEGRAPVMRIGSAPGDSIYITGKLGSSRAGLDILKSGNSSRAEKYRSLVACHKMPGAKNSIVEKIIRTYNPTSMIDISDGLISDINHIIKESGMGYDIDLDRIPYSKSLKQFCDETGANIYDYILSSGEEYELLFTSSSVKKSLVIDGIEVNRIGKVTEKIKKIHAGGTEYNTEATGFDHFNWKE